MVIDRRVSALRPLLANDIRNETTPLSHPKKRKIRNRCTGVSWLVAVEHIGLSKGPLAEVATRAGNRHAISQNDVCPVAVRPEPALSREIYLYLASQRSSIGRR